MKTITPAQFCVVTNTLAWPSTDNLHTFLFLYLLLFWSDLNQEGLSVEDQPPASPSEQASTGLRNGEGGPGVSSIEHT